MGLMQTRILVMQRKIIMLSGASHSVLCEMYLFILFVGGVWWPYAADNLSGNGYVILSRV